jgi:hypothetical protein
LIRELIHSRDEVELQLGFLRQGPTAGASTRLNAQSWASQRAHGVRAQRRASDDARERLTDRNMAKVLMFPRSIAICLLASGYWTFTATTPSLPSACTKMQMRFIVCSIATSQRRGNRERDLRRCTGVAGTVDAVEAPEVFSRRARI